MAMNRVRCQRALSMAEFMEQYCSDYQCAACRHQCSVISGTFFESTKPALTRCFLAMHLLTQAKNNVAVLELMRHLGVSYPTAWLVKHKHHGGDALARGRSPTHRLLTVVSDGLGCFTATEGAGVHERIVTGGGKASVKLPQFQAINTVLSNLKTAMVGTYHAIDFAKYAHRYLAEMQYRFSRRFDLRTILPRLVHAAAVTSPRTRLFIRGAEVGC